MLSICIFFILFSEIKFSYINFWLQIQRKLQLRIEEQGKQLKMMFDQQQKTNSTCQLNTQNLDNTSNNDIPISPKDIEVTIFEGSHSPCS